MASETPFALLRPEVEYKNRKLGSVDESDSAQHVADWLEAGDWLAAGERWCLASTFPTVLLKHVQGLDEVRCYMY